MSSIYEATWGRFLSATYDWDLRAAEDAGLREMRRDLLGEARGRVIEIGAGTGANLPLYPNRIKDLVLIEPNPHMRRRLQPKMRKVRSAQVFASRAESLPFDSDMFDTAVFTLALCTVLDPTTALSEAARVLRPSGRLLFIEHVRSSNPKLARWQDCLKRPRRFFRDGCHCNRDTVAHIESSPLTVERIERGLLPKAAPLVRPLVRGTAILR